MLTFVTDMWGSLKANWDLLIWKWGQAMKNHAKNGERNVYAEELLTYVLYGYISIGAIIVIYCILVFFNVVNPDNIAPLLSKL